MVNAAEEGESVDGGCKQSSGCGIRESVHFVGIIIEQVRAGILWDNVSRPLE